LSELSVNIAVPKFGETSSGLDMTDQTPFGLNTAKSSARFRKNSSASECLQLRRAETREKHCLSFAEYTKLLSDTTAISVLPSPS
jgi:hypothetical protein